MWIRDANTGVSPGDWFGILHYGSAFEVNEAFVAAGEALGEDLLDLSKDEIGALLADGVLLGRFVFMEMNI